MTFPRRALACIRGLALLMLVACGGDDALLDAHVPNAPRGDARADAPPDAAAAIAAVVGPHGGHVGSAGGPQLDIPVGALGSDTTITIDVMGGASPVAGAVSPVYAFGPSGTVFAHPVAVTLPVPPGTTGVSLYWSQHAGSGYDRVGGTLGSDGITASITHFSSGVVAATAGGRVVSGTDIVSYVTPEGITLVPTDLRSFAVTAVAPDGDGSAITISGVGSSDGTFTLSGVPDGEYTLQIGSSFFVTSATAFDAGSVTEGRPTVQAPTQDTSINVDLSGMTPWQGSDNLEAYSPEANAWWFGAQPIGSGSNTTAGISFASNSLGPNLVRGDLGDQFIVSHLTTQQAADGSFYDAITEAFSTSALVQTNGGSNTVTGTFAAIARPNTLSAAVRVTQFDSAAGWNGTSPAFLVPQPDPRIFIAPLGTSFLMLAMPFTAAFGTYGASADPLELPAVPDGGSDTAVAGVTHGTLPYGAWGLIANTWQFNYVQINLPGTNAGATYFPSIAVDQDPASIGSAAIAPLIGPPRSPTVDGGDLFVSTTIAAGSHELAWTAPTLGSAASYVVAVHHLYVDGSNNTAQETAVAFQTPHTRVTVPAGMLVAGEPYVVEISATTGGTSGGFASLVSGVLTVAGGAGSAAGTATLTRVTRPHVGAWCPSWVRRSLRHLAQRRRPSVVSPDRR